MRARSAFAHAEHLGNLAVRVSFDGKQVQHRAVSVGQFADTSQQLGGLHTFHGRCFGSFDLPERIDLLTALQHVFLAQIPQGRIDENPSDPSVQRSLAPEIPDFGENGDKAVVQQILSDLAMARIAETHAVHLRSVFFIQLLLRRPVIPTATPYQFFFRHGFQSYRSSVAIDERGS